MGYADEPMLVRNDTNKVFQNRFASIMDYGVRHGNVEFKAIVVHENASLIEKISESYGSNGFNFNFLKSNWEALKDTSSILLMRQGNSL